MASVQDFIKAGKEYQQQVAASSPTITTKQASIWFDEIADKLEFDQAVEEATVEYNLNLLDGENPITESEMEEILEEKMGNVGNGSGEKKYTDYDMMLKDDEIAVLKQRVDTLENMLRRLHSRYGIDWQQLRESHADDEIEVIQQPREPERF